MAAPRKGLGRVLVTLLLVVGFVLGPVAGRHSAAGPLAGGCHGVATVHAAHGHPAGHGHGHRAERPETLPGESSGEFEIPRLSAGLACLVHCSWLPVPASFAVPDRSPLAIEPHRPSAEPVSLEVEPEVPPPRWGEAT